MQTISPMFGRGSKQELLTCSSLLIDVFNIVVDFRDCKILEGHRVQQRQDYLFEIGQSEVEWPDGKHNSMPSKAVDAAPYFIIKPHIRWEDRASFLYFSGIVLGVAWSKFGKRLRWGGDWNRNHILTDQKFFDLVHFEEVE